MLREDWVKEILNQYDIVKVLSEKNGSSVLLLRHKTLKKEVVLRSYPAIIATYERLKAVSHPNIPLVLDSLSFDDGQVVIEEFIDGITVAQVLESGNYTYKGAKKIISEIGSALKTLHQMGIIHRDIKPENVIITNKGCVKLLDFNATRVHTANKSSDTVILGTIGYAPPEQFGISQSDTTADIYALGVLLNVMLTGCHPSEKLAKGKAGRIVLKCTQIDPNSRYQSVDKLIEAL